MMRTHGRSNVLSLFYKPLFIVFLLVGLFGLIWLRSSVVAIHYDIRSLEEKKMESLKEMKILLAERAKAMSLEKLDVSFRGDIRGEKQYAGGYIFPDRVKVIHIKRNRGPVPYRASLTLQDRDRSEK